jgi:hypothetical protein
MKMGLELVRRLFSEMVRTGSVDDTNQHPQQLSRHEMERRSFNLLRPFESEATDMMSSQKNK